MFLGAGSYRPPSAGAPSGPGAGQTVYGADPFTGI